MGRTLVQKKGPNWGHVTFVPWKCPVCPADILSNLPCQPIPPKFRGMVSPPKCWGGVSEAPCFTVFSGGRPLNLGGEIVTPKFRGYGLTGYVEVHKFRPGHPGCPGLAPKPSPGRFQGIPTTKFLYAFFVSGFSSLSTGKNCSLHPESQDCLYNPEGLRRTN